MAKGQKDELSYKKVLRSGYEYWATTITVGYDAVTGKQLRKTFYGKTKTEVKNKVKEYKDKNTVETGTIKKLEEFFHSYLFDYRKLDLKPSSFSRWEGIYRIYIKGTKLGKTKLTELTTLQLQRYYGALQEDKKDKDGNITPGKTVNVCKTINKHLGTCLDYALNQRLISFNPCKSVIFEVNHKPTVEDDKKFLDDKEIIELKKALMYDTMELPILLGLVCGMRLGEILALTPGDINFDTMEIDINKSIKRVPSINEDGTKTYKRDITVPKTKNSIRKITFAFCPELVPLFKELINNNKLNKLQYGELYCDMNLIFCNDNGTPIDDKMPNRRLQMICKDAEITPIVFHGLRHTCVSTMLRKGMAVEAVSRYVGHSDISITYNIYTHISKEHMESETDKLKAFYSNM